MFSARSVMNASRTRTAPSLILPVQRLFFVTLQPVRGREEPYQRSRGERLAEPVDDAPDRAFRVGAPLGLDAVDVEEEQLGRLVGEAVIAALLHACVLPPRHLPQRVGRRAADQADIARARRAQIVEQCHDGGQDTLPRAAAST